MIGDKCLSHFINHLNVSFKFSLTCVYSFGSIVIVLPIVILVYPLYCRFPWSSIIPSLYMPFDDSILDPTLATTISSKDPQI